MAQKYELVSSFCNKGKFTNERVMYMASLLDIDRITCMYYDSRDMLLNNKDFNFDIENSNTLSIRYHFSNSYKSFYMNALFDQKEMRDVIDNVHLTSFFIRGKKIFTEVVDVKNPFFVQMRSDFYSKLDNMGTRFIDEMMPTSGSNNLKLFIKNYLEVSNSTIYSTEDLQNFNEIRSNLNKEFSRYINFRNYIISLKKYNKNNSAMSFFSPQKRNLSIKAEAFKISNPVVNKNQPYYRVAEYLDVDDKEEFLEMDEIEKSVGEGNVIKGYKGYVRK